MQNLKKGDAVSWNAPGGSAEGHVEKKLTHDSKIKGHTVKAGKDDSQYLVKSDKGGKAAHKASALKKMSPTISCDMRSPSLASM